MRCVIPDSDCETTNAITVGVPASMTSPPIVQTQRSFHDLVLPAKNVTENQATTASYAASLEREYCDETNDPL